MASSEALVRSVVLPAGEIGWPALDKRHHALAAVLGPQEGHHVRIEARCGRRVPLGQGPLS